MPVNPVWGGSNGPDRRRDQENQRERRQPRVPNYDSGPPRPFTAPVARHSVPSPATTVAGRRIPRLAYFAFPPRQSAAHEQRDDQPPERPRRRSDPGQRHVQDRRRDLGARAAGLLQITEIVRKDWNAAHADAPVSRTDLFDPEINFRIGAALLNPIGQTDGHHRTL